MKPERCRSIVYVTRTARITTIEQVITRYRREVRSPGASSPELEIRIQNVDYGNFRAVYEALLAKKIGVDEGRVTQMVSSIMNLERSDDSQHGLRPMQIREIYFAGGERTGEKYVRKKPLLTARTAGAAGLSYTVALSSESPSDKKFSSDGSAVIRIKARVSFAFVAPARSAFDWRLDMSVTRQIAGSDAESTLQQIVDQMFRTSVPMTVRNFLTVLDLAEGGAPSRQLYRYEIEAEFMGPPERRDNVHSEDVTATAETILRLANPEHTQKAAFQAEVYRLAGFLTNSPSYARRFRDAGLKRLLPSVQAITRAEYRAIYPPDGLFLTVKADGKRAVAISRDDNGVVVSDVLHNFAAAKQKEAAVRGETLVDGELVDTGGGPVFYAFDVIAVAGEDVTSHGFEKRHTRLPEAVAELRRVGIPADVKAYTHIAGKEPRDLERQIRGVSEAEYPFPTDGLVLVEPGSPYTKTASYKWKDARHNTIDFLARRAPPSVLGKKPYLIRPGHELYFLFVGVTPDLCNALGILKCPGYSDLFGAPSREAADHFPVQFAPSDLPLAYLYYHPDGSPDLDGKIVEMRCAGECSAAGGGESLVDWEIVRLREERGREASDYGNNFDTAEVTWLNYVDPFPIEQLWEGSVLDYFAYSKTGIHRAQRALMSFVKTRRILAFSHADWVVDLGSGNGQDLGRYFEAGVGHLVAVDRDRAALSELVRRKYSFIRKAGDKRDRLARGKVSTVVHVLHADLASPHEQISERLESLGLRQNADGVICNFAIHYFLGDVGSLRNIVALVRDAVRPGGRLVITGPLGEKVHALFESERVPNGGAWTVFENGVPKYSLKRLYSSDTLEACGQRIGVLLPFSGGQYYEEYLVNSETLRAEFIARGFEPVEATNAADFIDEFRARNRTVAAELTPDDEKYIALHGELVFERNTVP